jgi:hypothetical protein
MKGAGHTPNTDFFFPENMIDHSSSPNFLTTGSRIINYRQHGKQTTAWQRSNSCNSRGSTDSMSERYYWNPLLLSQIVTQKKQFLWPLVWSQKHIVSNAQLLNSFHLLHLRGEIVSMNLVNLTKQVWIWIKHGWSCQYLSASLDDHWLSTNQIPGNSPNISQKLRIGNDLGHIWDPPSHLASSTVAWPQWI